MDIGRYSRRDVIKGGLGLAGILAFGEAPGILVKSMAGMRQGMVSGYSLPYDAEVEYLESTGTQYCKIGQIIGATSVIGRFAATQTPASGCYKAGSVGYNYNMGDDFGITSTRWCGSYDAREDVHLNEFVDIEYTTSARIVNGVSIGGNGAGFINGANAGKSLFIFCGTNGTNAYITGSGNYQAWRGRCAWFKVFSDNGLIRVLIPVRFTNELGQSEGAMYDKVSGQLFRNQGTGAFLYGRDINPISARSYVNDGLVAMWDGIENAGYGAHVDHSYRWDDLIGGFIMMTNKKVDVDFSDGYLHKGEPIYNGEGDPETGQGIRYYEPAVSLKNHLNSGLFTIEVVYSHDTTGMSSWQKDNYLDFGLGLRSSHGCIYFKVNGDIYLTNGVLESGTILTVSEIPNNVFISRALVIDKDSLTALVYENGTAISSAQLNPNKTWGASGSIVYTNTCIGNLGYGTALNNWNDSSTGLDSCSDIRAIRFYSRALSPIEIAANYAVDRQRFKLP